MSKIVFLSTREFGLSLTSKYALTGDFPYSLENKLVAVSMTFSVPTRFSSTLTGQNLRNKNVIALQSLATYFSTIGQLLPLASPPSFNDHKKNN